MGLELDFETDKNFNYDSNISMKIELKKHVFQKVNWSKVIYT